MIGEMIYKAREDKKMKKSELAKHTNINIGHLSHIESEQRNPSHRALKAICRALGIPCQPLMYTYDKYFTDEQVLRNMPNHISYDRIPAVTSVESFMECPAECPNAAFSLKVADDAMQPKITKNSYVFVELNSPLDNKDIGLFDLNGKILIRRFIVRQDGLFLRADNKEFADIPLNNEENYYIIGKVVGTNTGLIF